MLRSAYVTLVYLAFIIMGVVAPFVLSLGYVWVDTFDPQDVVHEFLNEAPVSLIMGVGAIASFVIMDRRKGPVTLTSAILVMWAVWVTLSTAIWAELPAQAWIKWDYAVKTIGFAALVPFVFRSRVQIEAFLQIYLFSIMLHFLPVGIKTMYSGGGYGRQLGVLGGNSLLAEGSTLAGVSLMLVPIILYLRQHTTILPKGRITNVLYITLAVTAVAAAVGTYERTALIGMAVVGIGIWVRSRRKVLFGVLGAAAISCVVLFTSTAWNERISTVGSYNTEGSALGRILVWKWTLKYVSTHPLGGGFNVYMIDTIEFPGGADGNPIVVKGKAFHSIYFEVLGEQGWVGLALFGSLILTSLLQLRAVARIARPYPNLAWARDLAFALQIALCTLLACGSFVGIAFQPMIYYLFTISACLRQYVRQVQRLGQTPEQDAGPEHEAAAEDWYVLGKA